MERLIAYALNMTVEQLIGALIILAIAYMFKRQNDLYLKYNTLNTLVFDIDKHTKNNGAKSGNSMGDFMLDWDGVPEKLVTVNMFNEWAARQKKKRGHIDTSKTEDPSEAFINELFPNGINESLLSPMMAAAKKNADLLKKVNDDLQKIPDK